MIQVNVNEQELFELIMGVYALEKTSAAPSAAESEDPRFLEVAQMRRGLLDKLHGLFDQKTMEAHDQQVGTPRCAATKSICFGARAKSEEKAASQKAVQIKPDVAGTKPARYAP